MTFPNEQRNCQRAEKELMVKTAFTAPGSFFGLMSICAAHRAVMAGRHSDLMDSSTSCHRVLHDPDYYIMKNNCIRAVNKKLSDPRVVLSDETFDTIINLLTSTLVVGLFGEARIHLTGLKRMVELRGGIADDSIRCSSILAGILVADVKCASGLMVKPVFPLTWDTQPVPSDIQRRIAPLRSSVLNKLGAALFANTLLSFPLLKILNVVRDLILYTQVNNEKPTVLSPEDHHFFRLLNCEAEHQLLSYIYMESEGDHTPPLGPIRNIHPIEAVTRTACICFLNYFMIVSPPSSGLGRALTKHLKNAMSKCALSQLSQLPQENYGVLAWALFIGAQGSAGQIERPWFVERLSRIAIICGWRNWEKVSSILWEYFYVSNTHGPVWKSIWDEAMDGLVVEEIES
ncbi:hypothetical protein PHISCL_00300 [Aspergillus sclerotialis]|uniref:Uncharacterized protein n=1 Tax=Aspergillus sclerotialis TaxID=2070753 RepID=A0A3A3A6T9_9EURO|nr:hypothetical protein PHISCL_00300 [Aspergillus sclerotialis]